jgi:hypothetical protein
MSKNILPVNCWNKAIFDAEKSYKKLKTELDRLSITVNFEPFALNMRPGAVVYPCWIVSLRPH